MNQIIKGLQKYFSAYAGLPREVYFIFASRIINAMGIFIFPLLALINTIKLGMSIEESSVWVTLAGLMFLPTSIIGGKLADSFGRKKVIVIADTIGALVYVGMGLTLFFVEPTKELIYFIIGAAGIIGLAESAHNAIIADLTEVKDREAAYSLSYLGFNLGFILGPAVGGLLLVDFFPFIFIGDGLTMLIATLLIAFFVKEKPVEDQELTAIEEVETGSLIQVLKKRKILLLFALIMMGYTYTYSNWGFTWPNHMAHMFGDRASTLYGFISSFNGFLVIALTPLITSLLLGRHGLTKITLGGVLYFIGFGALAFAMNAPYFFIMVVVFTTGEIMITISQMAYVTKITPASHRGRVSSFMGIVMSIGWSVGPLISGQLLKRFTYREVWLIVGAVMGVSTLLMLLLRIFEHRLVPRVAASPQMEEQAIE